MHYGLSSVSWVGVEGPPRGKGEETLGEPRTVRSTVRAGGRYLLIQRDRFQRHVECAKIAVCRARIECRINGKLGPRVAAAGPVALRARISRRARQPPNQTSPQRCWRRSAVGYAAAPRTPARQRDLRARAAEAAEGLLPRGDLDREGSIAFARVSPLSGCTTGACASAPSSKTRSVH